MPTRRRDPVSVPRHLPSSHVRHDYGIDESISRMGYLSNAVLEDQYDAAARSRGKDHQLMRTVNDAIRPMSSDLGTPSRIGRRSHRYTSLPPTARGRSVSPLTSSPSPSHHAKAIVPYTNTNAQRIRMAMTPSPSSLLSSKISDFLRGSSVPPRSSGASPSPISYKSYLDSANPPPPSSFDNARSTVAYKSFICDPSITSPFSTRSSYRPYRGYEPSASSRGYSHLPPSLSSPHTSSYRSSSVPHYDIVVDDDDEEEENGDGGGYQVGDYRRKYKSIRDRNPGRSNVLYYSTGTPEGSDEEDEVYVPRSRSGTYDYSRPSSASSLKLSSYDAPHDGSYESDMAEMYEYIPFGPSRQGILELTRHHDNANDEDDSDYSSASVSIPSSIPSSYTSSSLTQPHVPSVSLIPHSSPSSLSELTAPSSSSASLSPSFAQTPVFESILANTAARAREALRGSTIPYKDASLVLSVEGSALSEDGQNRYGFRYYPPPIPLKGSGLGLDERLLGIVPKASTPADSFLGGYLDRLRNLHSDIEHRADKEDDRLLCRSVVPRHIPSLPSYSHQTIHMPIQIAGRAQSVPVSSYRSPLKTGRTHRVDVFPLVETQLNLPKDTFRLPVYRSAEDSPARLSVLDKINIKAAIIGSKMEAEDAGKKKRPRSSYAASKYRGITLDPNEDGIYYNNYHYNNSGALHSSRPPLPKPTDRKAIRDVDGFTKPRNLMSWQYRVESSLSPDDLMDQPPSLSRVRNQLNEAKEKLDRQRQIMDRHKDLDAVGALTKRNDEATRGSRTAGGDPATAPMSEQRRNIRRLLAKTKKSGD